MADNLGVEHDRAHLFAWFLSDEGIRKLDAWLKSGLYRLDLPEHGALLSFAWLLQHGRAHDASEMVSALEPWAGQVRFWPYELTEPDAPGVHVATLPVVSARLNGKRPQRHVEAEREALSVWTPFTDKVLSHWWATRSSSGILGAALTPDWIDGAKELLAEYQRLAAENTLTKRHTDPKGNLQILLTGLYACVGGELDSRPMGRVRVAAANMVAKRGEPGSPRLAELRAAQARTAAKPSHAALAHDAAARLNATGRTGAVGDPVALLRGTPAEALPSVRKITRQATQAPLPVLLGHGIVRSAEVLAELAPQLTAETVASRYSDPSGGLLAKRLHRAFANRRSVLLLDRKSQVTVQALPWFNLLEQTGVHEQNQALAHAQAVDLATLALHHFPGTLIPNSLIRELTRLFGLASEEVPLTYELASDIFMDSFSPVFLRAAQETATVVGSTLYARYYGIDYGRILTMGTTQETSSWPRTTPRTVVPEFDALVRSRACIGPARWGYDVVASGKIIEQAQILTTQNLAVLVKAGVTLDWGTQARGAWNVAKNHLAKTAGAKNLRHRKNAAYAWRQAIFYLALSPLEQAAAFVDDETVTHGLGPAVTVQAEAIFKGLRETIEAGAPADGPFLGWVARPGPG
ncbi:hypothetical protein [Arthrobacter sp. W4I7]|uniref:hypothetical protein n=1 Tax=Arthrobacter sp. W4I7 TaxID=3042296 RepID=UPI0027D84736|nr:hypothetical protein [Arthrobacter sp. W4I7]